MKWLKRILLALIVLVTGAAVGGYLWIKSSAPDYSGELTLGGLNAPVDVWFDDYGIPHIKAESKADLYRAFGYVHASERLFQMEMLRRAGGGRLSEIIGPDLLQTDIMFRTIGISDYADESDSALHTSGNEAMLADIQAYLDGVNAFVNEGTTPREFSIIGIEKTPFTTRDLYLITGAMSFSFSQAQKSEPVFDFIHSAWGDKHLADLGMWHEEGDGFIPGAPDTSASSALLEFGKTASAVHATLPVSPLLGSNSWVVSGKRTSSGKVIFCNDTHIGYLLPQTWYEAYLECPGFELYGHFMGGVPFALVGRNAELSWGLTMLLNDDMDFYRETFDVQDTLKVMHKGQWTRSSVKEYRIGVKGQPDKLIRVRQTPHGPVINDAFDGMPADAPVSMYWTYTQLPNLTIEALHGLNNAHSMAEFAAYLPLIHAPGLNINYGDKQGNIAWWAAAKLIQRPSHVNSKVLLDGASGNDEMTGFLDFAANPRNINPESGYIATANEWPAPIDSAFYPGYYLPPYRGERIRERLASKVDWTADDMKMLLSDAVNEADAKALRQMLARLSPILRKSGDSVAEELIEHLRDWDGAYGPEEIAPAVFTRLQYHFLKEVCEDELGEERFALFLTTHQMRYAYAELMDRPDSEWYDNVHTDVTEPQDTVLLRAWNATAEGLTEELGANWKLWKWSKVSTLEMKHPLGNVSVFRPLYNLGPFPNYGSNETIRQGGFHLNGSGQYDVHFGSQMRIITDYSDDANCWNVTPAGQSGHPGSPHYDDQSPLYNAGEFRRQHFTSLGEEGIGSVLRLLP
jgi:penicillin G amidase